MSSQSLSAAERETTVTMTDADDVVRIWTAQRRVITALRKRANATEVKSGFYGLTEWAEFTVPAERFSFSGAVKGTRAPKSAAQMATTRAMRQGLASRAGETVPVQGDGQNGAAPEAVA